MRFIKKTVIFTLILAIGSAPVAKESKADGCSEYKEAPSSSSAKTLTILDTDVGTVAYERLITYSKGGHKLLGMAIAEEYEYFENCQYVGIGIMDGSGGNGFRPNYTLAIWHDAVDLETVRSVVYALIGASTNPVVSNGDCNVSCDGTNGRQFDGTIINEPVSTTTTTPQVVIEQPEAQPLTSNEIQVDSSENPIIINENSNIETVIADTIQSAPVFQDSLVAVSSIVLADSFISSKQTTGTKKNSVHGKKKSKKRIVKRLR